MKTAMLRIPIVFLFIYLIGCSGTKVQDLIPAKPDPEPVSQAGKSDAAKFLKVHTLGKSVSAQPGFDEFLSHIPDNKAKSRIYLARVDEFSLGAGYQMLDKWDMAIESGLIDGFIEKGMTITEKLDHVSPRDPSEYVGNSPMDAFYMHGIDLDDLKLIQSGVGATSLLTYQIIEFSQPTLSMVIYLRMIDLQSMKVTSSELIKVGDNSENLAKVEVDAYNDAYNIVKAIIGFPSALFDPNVKLGLLNADVLNITGQYKNPPSKKALAIENGIVSGLIDNSGYDKNSPVIIEKTTGFKLKFPAVYNSIVFNTSPILWEDWSEFRQESGCNVLFMYRYIPDNGVYVKVVNANENGKISYSNAFVFNGRTDQGIIENHNLVSEKLVSTIDLNLLRGKKLMIIDGDKHAVEAEQYFNSKKMYNEMNLAIEEGMITGLVGEEIDIYEKLKTLYLKRPWMYDDKVFNLNPLYLDDWDQLVKFGVERLIVYNNLISYESLTPNHQDYKKIATGIRVVDLTTGDILDVGEISNLEF